MFYPVPNLVSVTAAAPTGTASGSLVMAGLALAITPTSTGRILVLGSGNASNGTINDGGQWQLSFGTGTAPVNAAAVTGTQVGGVQTLTNDIAGAAKVPYGIHVLITGLTLNTPIWVDYAFAAITGGTFSLLNNVLIAFEL